MFLRLWFSLKRWDCLWFQGWEDLVQVLYGILNPLLLGVSTDILAQLGLEDYGSQGASAVGDFFCSFSAVAWGSSYWS